MQIVCPPIAPTRVSPADYELLRKHGSPDQKGANMTRANEALRGHFRRPEGERVRTGASRGIRKTRMDKFPFPIRIFEILVTKN